MNPRMMRLLFSTFLEEEHTDAGSIGGGGTGSEGEGMVNDSSPAPAPAEQQEEEESTLHEVDFAALSEEFERDFLDGNEGEGEDQIPSETPEESEEGQEDTSATSTPQTPEPAGTPPAQGQQPATATQDPHPSPEQAATPTPAPTESPPSSAQPAAQEPPAQSAAAPEPVTPERVAQAYSQYEAQIMPQLEQQYTTLMTPELTQELEENPAQAIPKLAARIHYQAHVAAYTGIMSQLPHIADAIWSRREAVREAEVQFYSRWPDLRAHQEVVNTTLSAYRNANPNATLQDMIEKAGVMAMLSAGLDPNPQQEQNQPSPQLPQTPRPAGTGGSGRPRPTEPGGATNIFERMAEEMLLGEDD